jgi:3-phenylpropionate/trans-cinnamate dioxygenase ferredoxin reductase subunit
VLDGGIVTDAGPIALARGGDAPSVNELGGNGLNGDVLAAGDLVRWPHPLVGGRRVRVEHWTNAVEQSPLAGRAAPLAPGARPAHEIVPYLWSDQHDVKIQAAGFPALAHRVELLESGDDGARIVAMGERAVGVVAFNAAAWLARCACELAAPSSAEDDRPRR